MSKLITHRRSIGDSSMKTTAEMAAIFATPDEARLVVVMKKKTFEVWERASAKVVASFELGQPGGAPGVVNSAALSDDGKSLFVGWNTGHLDRYDVATGKQVFSVWAVKIEGQQFVPAIQAIAVDRVGRRVITHADTEAVARVWDATTGALVRELHDERKRSPIALSSDGGFAWVSSGLYDLATDKLLRRHAIKEGWNAAFFFPRDTRVALANHGGDVAVIDGSNGDVLWSTRVERGYFQSLGLTADGATLVGLGFGLTTLDAATGRVLCNEGYVGWKEPIVLPRAAEVIGVHDSKKSLIHFDLRAGKKIVNDNHEGPVVALAVSPLGRTFASGSTDRSTHVWHLEAGDDLQTFLGYGKVVGIAYAPDGMSIAIADESRIWGYRLGTSAAIFQETNIDLQTRALAFSPDGKRLLACDDRGNLRIWDFPSKTVSLDLKRVSAKYAHFGEDGATILVASTMCVLEVRDAKTGAVLRSTPTLDNQNTHEAFMIGDRILSVITKKGLALRAFGSSTVEHTFGSPELAERLLTVSRDRTVAVTVGKEGEVAVWRVSPDPALVDVVLLEGDRAESAAFSPDGRSLVVGTARGMIHVYDFGAIAATPALAPPKKPKPPPAPARDPIEVLHAFAAGTASKMEALRALVEHDGWVVPAVAIVKGDETFEHALLLGAETRLPPGEFWAFTDKPHTLQAAQQGVMLGLMVDPVPGTRVFSSLGQSSVFHVNRGAPSAETWSVPAESYDLCTLFAKVVLMERMLDTIGEPDEQAVLRELAAYEGYLLFLYDDGEHQAPAECHEKFGLKRAAHVFTTPDQRDAFAKKNPGMLEGNYKAITVPGSKLFGWLKQQRFIDGFVVNSEGRAPRGIPLDVCDRILALPRAP